MAEYERKVREILTLNGCHFVRRGRGDHDIWENPKTGNRFPVDGKIKSRHTANRVMKEAGIVYRF